jgi:cell division protein FtsW
MGKDYQVNQSLIAIGSGGLSGTGLSNSRQKYGFLPVAQNDFIFAIGAEEFGFIGSILIILIFLIFVLRGFYIASKSPDKFGMLLVAGITFQIGLQAILNIAVVTGVFPNTGISLPFFSYGGTALFIQLCECGILLAVSRKSLLG